MSAITIYLIEEKWQIHNTQCSLDIYSRAQGYVDKTQMEKEIRSKSTPKEH